MKKSIILGILIVLCSVPVCISQNLVPNWEFEQHAGCPTSISDIGTLNHWYAPTAGSSDYYNVCGVNGANIPSLYSTELPHSGDGYAGIICYMEATGTPPGYREYITVALTEDLIAGYCYEFEMFVNMSEGGQYSIVELGVYFSDSLVSTDLPPPFSPTPLLVTPQLENTNGFLNDISGWTSISGTYTALGGESFITIGNFNDDLNTTVELTNPSGNENIAYYLIEDVSLIECEENSLSEENNLHSVNTYPNPFSETLTITSSLKSSCEVIIYDLSLNVVSVYDFTNSIDIDTRFFEPGLYFYKVTNKEGEFKSGKLLKQ